MEVFTKQDFIPVFFSKGIWNRVELSGMVFPCFIYGQIWYGNIKLNAFDIGTGNLRNLAAAVFSGATGYHGDTDDQSNYYYGFSLGSHVAVGKDEIEIILQSSWAQEHNHLTEGGDTFSVYWFQPALGGIYSLGKSRDIEIHAGLNYSYPIGSKIFIEDYSTDPATEQIYTNTAHGGLSVLLEVRCNFHRKKGTLLPIPPVESRRGAIPSIMVKDSTDTTKPNAQVAGRFEMASR